MLKMSGLEMVKHADWLQFGELFSVPKESLNKERWLHLLAAYDPDGSGEIPVSEVVTDALQPVAVELITCLARTVHTLSGRVDQLAATLSGRVDEVAATLSGRVDELAARHELEARAQAGRGAAAAAAHERRMDGRGERAWKRLAERRGWDAWRGLARARQLVERAAARALRARVGAALLAWTAAAAEEAWRRALMQRAASLQRASQPVGRRAWRTWTEAAEAQRARDLGEARRALGGCFWRWAQRAEASHLAVAEAEAEAERLWRLPLEPSSLSPNPSALIPRL